MQKKANNKAMAQTALRPHPNVNSVELKIRSRRRALKTDRKVQAVIDSYN